MTISVLIEARIASRTIDKLSEKYISKETFYRWVIEVAGKFRDHNMLYLQEEIGVEGINEELINLAENGFIQLPVDADGVPIKPGDEVRNSTIHGIVTDIRYLYDQFTNPQYRWIIVIGAFSTKPESLHHVSPEDGEQ